MPYPLSDPFIYSHHGRWQAVFEIAIPTPELGIDFRDDLADPAGPSPGGLFPDGLPQLFQALLPGPFEPAAFAVALKVIPQEVESALLRRVNYPRLLGVEL